MALRDIRLRPYVWSIPQAVAFGTAVGALCGVLAWLFGWRPGDLAVGPLVQFWMQVAAGAGASALVVSCAALVRNAVTRGFYGTQKLETLRAAAWASFELALFGLLTGAAMVPPVLAGGLRAPGALADLQPMLVVALSALAGAVYLPMVGLARHVWMARHRL